MKDFGNNNALICFCIRVLTLILLNTLHHLMGNPNMEQDTIMQILDKELKAGKATLIHEDNEGYTPFHFALRVLPPEICFRLLDLGADMIQTHPGHCSESHRLTLSTIGSTTTRPTSSIEASI